MERTLWKPHVESLAAMHKLTLEKEAAAVKAAAEAAAAKRAADRQAKAERAAAERAAAEQAAAQDDAATSENAASEHAASHEHTDGDDLLGTVGAGAAHSSATVTAEHAGDSSSSDVWE